MHVQRRDQCERKCGKTIEDDGEGNRDSDDRAERENKREWITYVGQLFAIQSSFCETHRSFILFQTGVAYVCACSLFDIDEKIRKEKVIITYPRSSLSWSFHVPGIDLRHARSRSSFRPSRRYLRFGIPRRRAARTERGLTRLTWRKCKSSRVRSSNNATTTATAATTATTSTSQAHRDVWRSRVCRRRGAAVMTTAYDKARVCALQMCQNACATESEHRSRYFQVIGCSRTVESAKANFVQ